MLKVPLTPIYFVTLKDKRTAMNQLTEYYKILQRFSSLYAGEGDDELARHAADAITPLAENGNIAAENALNNKKFRDFKR